VSASASWRGGIIAAGLGERLKAGGLAGSKPMAVVGGRPLIDHAVDRLREAGIARVSVLINAESPDARARLEARGDVDLVVKTTPSSYASFSLMAERLAGSRAVITTVDGIMPSADFTAFVQAAAALPADAVGLGVTGHVDDESPLWAELAPDGRIRRLGGEPAAHVTAGLYTLPAQTPPQGARRFERLRDYLGWLVAEGHPVYGLVLPMVLDVDRPWDIAQAERVLAAEQPIAEGAS
jgi:NDP-sugar pyrophosphorylase family protein